MVTLTCLTVLKRDNQVRRHLGNALNLGLTPIEIIEVLMHSSFYSGVPATLDALAIANQVFQERGIDYTPQRVFDTSETPDQLNDRGIARRVEYMGPPSDDGQGPVTEAEKADNRILLGLHLDTSRFGLTKPLHMHHGSFGSSGPRNPTSQPHKRRAKRRTEQRRDRRSIRPRHILLRTPFYPLCN